MHRILQLQHFFTSVHLLLSSHIQKHAWICFQMYTKGDIHLQVVKYFVNILLQAQNIIDPYLVPWACSRCLCHSKHTEVNIQKCADCADSLGLCVGDLLCVVVQDWWWEGCKIRFQWSNTWRRMSAVGGGTIFVERCLSAGFIVNDTNHVSNRDI